MLTGVPVTRLTGAMLEMLTVITSNATALDQAPLLHSLERLP